MRNRVEKLFEPLRNVSKNLEKQKINYIANRKIYVLFELYVKYLIKCRYNIVVM